MSAITPEFGVTTDGHLAARVGDLAYVAIPAQDGFRLASGWRTARPIGEWTRYDAFGSEGVVADETGFREHIEAIALDLTQRMALGRQESRVRISTPWGMSQGVVFHSTASHGGFKLDRARNAALPTALRIAGGFYEEDGDWARVTTGFPELFTDREKATAERILRDWEPDAWEAIYGRPLAPEESFVRDRQRFEREHVQDWVVIAAVNLDRYPGEVEAVATIGGRRDAGERRRFLVPKAEYRAGRHGFVVDLQLHRAIVV